MHAVGLTLLPGRGPPRPPATAPLQRVRGLLRAEAPRPWAPLPPIQSFKVWT